MPFTRHVDMTDQQVANLVAWKNIVIKAWSDDDFKSELMADPNTTLEANGFQVEAGVNYEIAEDSATKKTLILPAAPDGDVSVQDMGQHSDYDPGF